MSMLWLRVLLTSFFVVGYGGLSLSVEGPSKADMECLEESDGICKVRYRPTEPGNYIVNIKFADEHIPGTWNFLQIFYFLLQDLCFVLMGNYGKLNQTKHLKFGQPKH